MSHARRIVLLSLLCLAGTPLFAEGYWGNRNIYVRSNVSQPWGQTTNEDAMDSVFGSDMWTTMYYETLDMNELLSSHTQFLFLQGGNTSYSMFESFMNTNRDALNTWVSNGGNLLIMAAPNDPLVNTSVYLLGNVVLLSDSFYKSAASSAYATDATNPIFTGPNSTSQYFTGNFFAHGYFVGGDVTAIMVSNLGEVVLGSYTVGNGIVYYGGLTTDNFALPQPDAHNLIMNVISYVANYTPPSQN